MVTLQERLKFGRLILLSNFKTLYGIVFGNMLVTGISTQYRLKTDMYNGKQGYFLVKDGLVYNYVFNKRKS